MIIGEISVIGRETFGHSDLTLKAIMQNLSPLGGISLLVVRDFLKLPPVNQKDVFMKPNKGSHRSFNEWLWEKFQLHELVEIARQSSDPDFAQLFNRLREGQQTDNDVIQIKALPNTDIATWPDEFVKVYLKKRLDLRAKRFPLKKGKSTVIAERKQFLLILGHAITVHKSQGSTLAYMQGDLN